MRFFDHIPLQFNPREHVFAIVLGLHGTAADADRRSYLNADAPLTMLNSRFCSAPVGAEIL